MQGLSLRWVFVILFSLGLGAVFTWLGVPASWLVAALLSAATAALRTGRELKVPTLYYSFSAGIVGILAAVPLVEQPASDIISYLVPGVAVSLTTVTIALGLGYVAYRRHMFHDFPTSALSILPGGAAFMPAMAQEMGANMQFVSLIQYLRLLCVALSLPLVTALIRGRSPTGSTESFELFDQDPVGAVLAIVIALAGGPLARRLKIPAPAILGPIAVALIVAPLLPEAISLEPATVLQIMAFLSVGWLAGGAMSVPILKKFVRLIPGVLGMIAVLMGLCALVAVPLAAWIDVTYYEAYLATTPGALDTVLAVSVNQNVGAAVITIQVIRLLVSILAASVIAWWIGRKSRH